MPFQPLRFIHAAHLNLDRPLVDTGELTGPIREMVQHATVTAFERIVNECIAQRVDFLVLTENSFRERDRSLRARLALLSGLRRLADHDVDVFVLPGELDPDSSWKAISSLQDNVTIFRADSTEPVAYMRDGHVVATLALVGSQETPQQNPEAARSNAFSIGLLTAAQAGLSESDLALASIYSAFNNADESDESESVVRNAARQLVHQYGLSGFNYLAIGSRRRVSCELDLNSLAHSPGASQALFSLEGGPHGCSLIDVSGDGDINCQQLLVAPVRREAIPLVVNADATRSELVEWMQQATDQLKVAKGEQACLIDWAVIGSGALFKACLNQAFQEQVLAANEIEVLLDGVQLSQRLHCVPSRRVSGPPQRAVDNLAGRQHVATGSRRDAALDSDLQLEFVSLLNQQAAVCRKLMNECLKQEHARGEQLGQLQAISVDVDSDAVMAHAQQAGERWFEVETEAR